MQSIFCRYRGEGVGASGREERGREDRGEGRERWGDGGGGRNQKLMIWELRRLHDINNNNPNCRGFESICYIPRVMLFYELSLCTIPPLSTLPSSSATLPWTVHGDN